jgi:predicted TIM-barrel fold metal-dependent hydrolase
VIKLAGFNIDIIKEEKKMGLVIDLEHHIRLFGQGSVNPEESIKWMDEMGIDMALFTNHIEATGPIEAVREANDLTAKAVKKYPKRYIGCATVPIVEGKPDLGEVERAIKGLGLQSVHIATRPGDPGPLHMDSRELWPFYEKMSKLNVPFNIEITQEPGFEELKDPKFHLTYPLHFTFAREFAMAEAVLRVCLGGVLEDFPDLKIIMDHYGGGVSSLIDRLDLYWDGKAPYYLDKPLITKPWREYFKKIYFGTAGRGASTDTLKMCLVNISPQKIMYATDWPYYGVQPKVGKQFITNIKKLDLPKGDIDGILGENAARLFGIKK